MCSMCGLRASGVGQRLNGNSLCLLMSKINLDASDWQQWVHRYDGDSLNPSHVNHKVQGGGISVDVWPHMVLAGFIALKAPLTPQNIWKSSKTLCSPHLCETIIYPLQPSSCNKIMQEPTDHTQLQISLPALESKLFPGLPIHQTWT